MFVLVCLLCGGFYFCVLYSVVYFVLILIVVGCFSCYLLWFARVCCLLVVLALLFVLMFDLFYCCTIVCGCCFLWFGWGVFLDCFFGVV